MHVPLRFLSPGDVITLEDGTLMTVGEKQTPVTRQLIPDSGGPDVWIPIDTFVQCTQCSEESDL